MINLKQGYNEVFLTLNELSQSSTPRYIFEFKNTGEVVRFTSKDVSDFVDRYNKFRIIVNSGSTDILEGYIDLKISGLWDYKIYEYSDEITESVINNTNYNDLNIVQVGKMRVDFRKDDKIYKENTLNKKLYIK